ncbi:MAG: hypothetical protein IKN96_09140 [Oscillibacter sp.]|nr:hypothetical protein [Oscillibacter sp.]
MAGNRATAAKNAPQSQKGREQKTDFRAPDALRRTETLSPAAALRALRLGARLSPEQAAALSHAVGNRALEELLSGRNGPELLERPLPMGGLRTPPLSVPDGAPEAPLATALPAWDAWGEGEPGLDGGAAPPAQISAPD